MNQFPDERKNLPTLSQCIQTIRELCVHEKFSEPEIMQRARLLYFINRLDFWEDFPILFDLINYEKQKVTDNKL